MSNLGILISLPVGVLGFLFLFWKRLRQDYAANQIFAFSFIVIGFLLAGFFFGTYLTRSHFLLQTNIFTPVNLWFWLSFVFASIGFFIGFFLEKGGVDFKPGFYELIDATCVGFIFFFASVTLIYAILSKNLFMSLFSLFCFFLIWFYYYLHTHYKSFTWYRSGKTGFAGLVTFGLFFLIRCPVALLAPTMISFIGKIDSSFSIIVSFGFFALLYNLSQKS